MGNNGRLIVPGETIVEVLPTDAGGRSPWQTKRKLKLSAEVSRALAIAHLEMVQEACCVVREGMRGPRGGRGQMRFNGAQGSLVKWPGSWREDKHTRFFLVVEIVAPSHTERAAKTAEETALAYGASPAQAERIAWDNLKRRP